MKLLTSIIKYFSIGGPSFNSPSWLFASGINPQTRDKDFTPEQVATLTAVHRACTLYSDSLSASQWDIIKKIPSGGHQTVHGTDASSALSNWDFSNREAFIFSAALLGDGFSILHRNERGGISDIETVMKWRVSLEYQGKKLFYRVAADENMNQPIERLIPAENMLHLKWRVTGKHSALGESPLVRLLPALDAVLRVREGQRAVFKNLASPGIYYSTEKPLPTEAAKRLKTALDDKLAGDGLGKSIILDNGIEAKAFPIAETINLQLVELSRFNISEVARAWAVPTSLLSETGEINNSTASEQNRQFATISLKPFARRLEDCISQKLFTRNEIGTGMKVSIDLLPLLLGAGSETAEYYSKLLNSGLMSVNEARNKNGLPDVSNGDVLRSPVNTISLDYWAEDYRPGETPASDKPEKQLSDGREKLMNIMRAS